MFREPRYTTPEEQARIRRCIAHLTREAVTASSDRNIIDRYTYLFRTVFNSMLRDRSARFPIAPRGTNDE